FPLGLQFLGRVPERAIIDLFHPNVVQLEQIDPICLQTLQRRICRVHDAFRRKILRNFPLTASARLTVMDKIVTDLGCDHDLIPLFRKRFGDQLFTQTVSISISGVEQRDAEIKRLVHERNRFALGKISPPPGGNSPQTEADFADRWVGVFVSAEAHQVKTKRSASNAQHPTLRLKSAKQLVSFARRMAIRDQTAMQLRILYRATASHSPLSICISPDFYRGK